MDYKLLVALGLVLGVVLAMRPSFTTCFKAENAGSWVEKWLYG